MATNKKESTAEAPQKQEEQDRGADGKEPGGGLAARQAAHTGVQNEQAREQYGDDKQTEEESEHERFVAFQGVDGMTDLVLGDLHVALLHLQLLQKIGSACLEFFLVRQLRLQLHELRGELGIDVGQQVLLGIIARRTTRSDPLHNTFGTRGSVA